MRDYALKELCDKSVFAEPDSLSWDCHAVCALCLVLILGFLYLAACVLEALLWQAERSCSIVMAEREAIMVALELANTKMRDSGLCQEWFNGCDEITRRVSREANGQLFQDLLVAADYRDADCVELLRQGLCHACIRVGCTLCCSVLFLYSSGPCFLRLVLPIVSVFLLSQVPRCLVSLR